MKRTAKKGEVWEAKAPKLGRRAHFFPADLALPTSCLIFFNVPEEVAPNPVEIL
jgi:hypothetical protein